MCYCTGWAKVHVRRPTGDTCWAIRILNPPQSINDVFLQSDWSEEPAPNLAALLVPQTDGTSMNNETNRGHSKLDRSVSAAASFNTSSSKNGENCFVSTYWKVFLNCLETVCEIIMLIPHIYSTSLLVFIVIICQDY